MIRQLTIDDAPSVRHISSLKDRSSNSAETVDQTYAKYYEPNDTYFMFGYFEDDELISWINISFYENTFRGRFWVISNLTTSRFNNAFTFGRPEIGILIQYVFKFAESRKYYRYFYCVPEKWEHVYERQWKKNTLVDTGKYTLELFDRVPANTKPEFELYWKLMGQQMKPDVTLIKARTLRQEFIDRLEQTKE